MTTIRFVLAIALLLLAPAPVAAAPITVTTLADSGSGSLREAITNAAAGDTITFSVTGTITLSTALPGIGKNLNITGPGPSSLTIDGNNSVQVLFITNGATVSISGLTVANGNDANGGGIQNEAATLHLSQVVVTGCSGTQGGGIDNVGGTLTLDQSTVSHNTASSGGGGIFNVSPSDGPVATATITNSTISNNSYSGSAEAGGIENLATMTIRGSTISSNSANVGGGGIDNYGTLTIVNSTFAGNTGDRGGAIFNVASGPAPGILKVSNSTFSGNQAATSGDTIYSAGALTLKGTILANPVAANCAVSGTLSSSGYNLSDDNSCSGFLNQTGDLNVTPAGLSGGLANNGGPTQTIALSNTSAAVNAIPASSCSDIDGNALSTDQRGTTRPQSSGCEIGAYELFQGLAFSSFTAKLRTTTSGFSLNSNFTLSATSNGINPLTETVALQIGSYSVTIPAGRFTQIKNGQNKGDYTYTGTINGVNLSVQIAPTSSNSWTFKASGTPADLTAAPNPISVTITVGDDTGMVLVNANH